MILQKALRMLWPVADLKPRLHRLAEAEAVATRVAEMNARVQGLAALLVRQAQVEHLLRVGERPLRRRGAVVSSRQPFSKQQAAVEQAQAAVESAPAAARWCRQGFE